jgi:trans-aconitate methyltransferase
MSFDRLAPHYRRLEWLLAGPRLQHCRLVHLEQLDGCRDVLLAGEGHGRFLVAARRRWPELRLVHLDASPAMQRAARTALHAAGLTDQGVEFITADLRAWTAPPRFDAVVTQFALDCFAEPELSGVIGTLAAALRPAAQWLWADFQVPDRGWRRVRARLISAAMYAVFRPLTGLTARRVEPVAARLRAHGFVRRDRVEAEWGLLAAEHWTRAGGASGHCPPKWHRRLAGVGSPGALAR